MAEKIVKDSQGLAKDLVNDTISRSGVSAWLANMGYSKLADVLMDKNRFPSAQPETHDKRTETHACDCISKTAAIDIVEFECGEWRGLAKTIAEEIEQLPSAQPERKRGKWVFYEDRAPVWDIAGEKTWAQAYKCSECGFVHSVIEDFGRYGFCPNCGADMRGEADE